jgi:hypothetical protein
VPVRACCFSNRTPSPSGQPGMILNPVIILKHLRLPLPPKGTENRIAKINELHQTLISEFVDFLKTDDGKYLTRRFKEAYKSAKINKVKILDFVLWVTRKKKKK